MAQHAVLATARTAPFGDGGIRAARAAISGIFLKKGQIHISGTNYSCGGPIIANYKGMAQEPGHALPAIDIASLTARSAPSPREAAVAAARAAPRAGGAPPEKKSEKIISRKQMTWRGRPGFSCRQELFTPQRPLSARRIGGLRVARLWPVPPVLPPLWQHLPTCATCRASKAWDQRSHAESGAQPGPTRMYVWLKPGLGGLAAAVARRGATAAYVPASGRNISCAAARWCFGTKPALRLAATWSTWGPIRGPKHST
jgi:hypothetical protein